MNDAEAIRLAEVRRQEELDRAMLERLIDEYLKVAEHIRLVRHIKRWEQGRDGCGLFWIQFALGVVVFVVSGFLGAVFYVLNPPYETSNTRFVAYLTGAIVTAIYAVFAIIYLIRSIIRVRRERAELIAKVSAENPGFAEFYKKYIDYMNMKATISVAQRRETYRKLLGAFLRGATVGSAVKVYFDVTGDARIYEKPKFRDRTLRGQK